MSGNAFDAQGDSVAIDLTSTASDAVQVAGAGAACSQYLINNALTGGKDCWVAMGTDDTVEAVIPADGTPANGILVPLGAVFVLSGPPNAYFSGICDGSDTSTIFITPGEGV